MNEGKIVPIFKQHEQCPKKNCNKPLEFVDKSFMPRKTSGLPLRGKLNLTIHPEIRAYADELAGRRRRSVSQLVEDLIEAEWMRQHQQPPMGHMAPPVAMIPHGYSAPQPYNTYTPPSH